MEKFITRLWEENNLLLKEIMWNEKMDSLSKKKKIRQKIVCKDSLIAVTQLGVTLLGSNWYH